MSDPAQPADNLVRAPQAVAALRAPEYSASNADQTKTDRTMANVVSQVPRGGDVGNSYRFAIGGA